MGSGPTSGEALTVASMAREATVATKISLL